jgi:lipopolysaccharide export system protein LptA
MRLPAGRTGSLLVVLLLAGIRAAAAQPLDLSQGGPITITARDGLEWHQTEQEVIALGDARAVRQNVTVTADRLIAFYRKKLPEGTASDQPAGAPPGGAKPGGVPSGGAPPGGTKPASAQPSPIQPVAAQSDGVADTDTSGTEIYRLRAEGHVQIFTPTDHAQGDVAVYDIDQAVLVMTGHDLRLTTPNDVLTARDTLEYWPQKHMAVARGDAVVVTRDARRVAADVLVAYTEPPPPTPAAAPGAAKAPAKQAATTTTAAKGGTTSGGAGDDLTTSGKLEKVEAFGHVSVRTPTDTAIGERAVYVPDTGIARLAGNVRVTRGQNQLDGQEAEVNMKTGIARLLRGNTGRVTGLVVPNDATNHDLSTLAPPEAGAPSPGAPSPGGAPPGGPTQAAKQAKPTGGHP